MWFPSMMSILSPSLNETLPTTVMGLPGVLRGMDSRFEQAPVGVLAVDADHWVCQCNEAARDLLNLDATVVDDEPVRLAEIFPESVEETVPRTVSAGPDEPTTVEEYYPVLDRWLAVTLVPIGAETTLYLRDCSRRYTDRQTIERLQGELDRLSNINALISAVLEDLVGASTRAEIAETICRRLGETDLYAFAWVGERKIGSDDIVVRAVAGETGRTMDEIRTALDGDTVGPEQRAVETTTSQLVQSVSEDESVPEAVRRAAFADGIQSLLAIPLTYGSNVYGLVAVYATDQDAFSERERSNFETVGEMAGFAINAARHRNLLLADTVIEIELAISDRGDPFVDAATAHESVLSLDGIVPQREGDLICYLTVETGDVEPVVATLDSHDEIAEVRIITEYDEGGGALEVSLEGDTPLSMLSARGATFKSAAFDPGHGTLTVELPPEEDVRRIVDALSREYVVDLQAKRQRERDGTTRQEFRDELRDALTERQENALRAAFFADYFESPRGSSSREVAEALDITGPTLLYHLRAGQRKVLAEFFETTGETG